MMRESNASLQAAVGIHYNTPYHKALHREATNNHAPQDMQQARLQLRHLTMQKTIVKQHVRRVLSSPLRVRNAPHQRAAGIHWNTRYPRVRHPARKSNRVIQGMQRIHRRLRHITMQKPTVQNRVRFSVQNQNKHLVQKIARLAYLTQACIQQARKTKSVKYALAKHRGTVHWKV